jgi:1-deoxy-D-xylulose-5-phosphate synthase
MIPDRRPDHPGELGLGQSAADVDHRLGQRDVAGLRRSVDDRDLVVVLEDNIRAGGIGTSLRTLLEDAGVSTPALTFGMPPEVPEHGPRAHVLLRAGLSAQEIARRVTERVAAPLPDLSDSIANLQDPRG